MERTIRKAAVLGSGVMGAAIAAHLANVGIHTLLLDMAPKGETETKHRNELAEAAKKRLLKSKPSPIYIKDVLNRIEVGNFDDHLHRIAEVDWVIEVIIENLEIKQKFFERLEQHWNPGTIISSNTSGISIHAICKHNSEQFKSHFLGTHFFNPPRYMKLLEFIPTENTDPNIISFMKNFCEKKLGKGVVIAKDTPNFIANRIGTYGLLSSLKQMEKLGLSVSEVDELTGPLIGRPKSATFRTLDLVGIDTFVFVANNVYDNVTNPIEKQSFKVPQLMEYMVEQGYIGEKAGSGFYQKKRTDTGKVILQLDVQNKTYVPRSKSSLASVEAAKNAKGLKNKLKALLESDDKGGQFTWELMKKGWLYAASKIPEISDDIQAIDEAMKWGFNWELGPFEAWDAVGVVETVSRMKKEGEQIPKWIEAMLAAGKTSFYEKQNEKIFYVQIDGSLEEKQTAKEILSLDQIKEKNGVIKKNTGASLIDIGDDVACLQFHSMNNTIGPDVLQMVLTSLNEVRKNYRGLVIGHQKGKNFCVGANLMMLLMAAQDEDWFEIEQMITGFHQMAMGLKYFEKPIVAAPFGMTLGGGVEVCLPSSHVQASAETYIGLVEMGVGLIPAGGGTKEMLYRATVPVDIDKSIDLQPFVNRVFETIGMAKVSTSAAEAKELGLLRSTDRITMNPDHLIYDAKQAVLGMSIAGYEPPTPKKVRVVGEPGFAALKMGLYQMKMSGYISEHDELIGTHLANILTGGKVAANSLVTEKYLLDLEMEAFLSLCGEPKSQERIQHMLLTRKPLRN
ncbi:3-hydroxyacyl-CoA dehydrogenase/enoyl-CoA hydratase family protein [Chengkuizengella axinellae]|uniref:3-hydroxyacyl-CoA dehydrogenase/enoyl-CoA hydratase family protein n=1 Tax=Chengkuizengella axinellae TaxID=3064388 RepID=A0ABT9J4Z8_9BACL|nr:3-hydroxyacyl-CoA dehydrogenase/enoyl-CoA hydratase family protein [Chengkuizengella sp. 2205SS18-9]MDP5276694.1 3-hydroxyacyl-CoA dehydrogenase/enoyl-CoA hydratase family protein [Chengkuizengella sp. 2205SS18-9]